VTAWLAHLYTATGAVAAFLATTATLQHDYRRAFFWLYVQVLIDATDGVLARALNAKERLPWFNGAKLDDIVDYLCYVFVPALIVWQVPLVPGGWRIPIAAAMMLSSAYGFNRDDAKTEDHYFLGFPSYWNIVALYLFVAQWPAHVNGVILLALAALVFVPIHYLYPSRGSEFKTPTLVLGAIWGALMLVLVWRLRAVSRSVFLASLVFPVYYSVMSLWLEFRRRNGYAQPRSLHPPESNQRPIK
jgi:phosphatidylcholine synthase